MSLCMGELLVIHSLTHQSFIHPCFALLSLACRIYRFIFVFVLFGFFVWFYLFVLGLDMGMEMRMGLLMTCGDVGIDDDDGGRC